MTSRQSTAKVIHLPRLVKPDKKPRKSGLNRNKEGSVRNTNGKVYVDFIYLDERVREPSGLPWNHENAKAVRQQLDRIIVAIDTGEFRFANVFPKSKKAEYFTEKESHLYGGNKTPDQVKFKEYALTWYKLLKYSERVTQRTLLSYKSYIDRYLVPYFGECTFAHLNKATFDKFIVWSKKQRYRGKTISNSTVNKLFLPLKMICKDAAIEYGWLGNYDPFFGFNKLPEGDAYDHIHPFSKEEQNKIVDCMSEHWKPYFRFAFYSGVRQGEQRAIKPGDIDWENKTLRIQRAFTRDEEGKDMVGTTKNKYSRRTIDLNDVMFDALKAQKEIYDQFKGKYFFCSTTGHYVDPSNIRFRVWIPALKKAGIEYREMKQTRHSFATHALTCGVNPLWIAKMMGHRNTEMIIKVYSKYIENADSHNDGAKLDRFYRE